MEVLKKEEKIEGKLDLQRCGITFTRIATFFIF